ILVISGNTLIHPQSAWGLETSALKPQTVATLIQLARDIYPHDQIPDRFYALAVKPHDAKAGSDPDHRKLIEEGVGELDGHAGKGGYLAIGWEDDRLAILRKIEDTPFFQAVRGGLVTDLYNQKEIWPFFGYEGESYSKGGYIARGFDDIEWL
ncbi:MAG: gluconate 2-dehydrogenase subunit 3 family protein, partial [Alphaproteobacteria bacterium]